MGRVVVTPIVAFDAVRYQFNSALLLPLLLLLYTIIKRRAAAAREKATVMWRCSQTNLSVVTG